MVELLVVIAVIAILAVIIIIALNPAELLRQARDSQRIADMSTMKGAISSYIQDQPTGSLGSTTPSDYCYLSVTPNGNGVVAPGPAGWSLDSSCLSWFSSATQMVGTTSRSTSGTGWVPINFAAMTGGSPIGSESVDPANTPGYYDVSTGQTTPGYFYSYTTNGASYKIVSIMESNAYSKGGSKDIESNDGGTDPYVYEQGLDLSL